MPFSPVPLRPLQRVALLLPLVNHDPLALANERLARYLAGTHLQPRPHERLGLERGTFNASALLRDLDALLAHRKVALPDPVSIEISDDGALVVIGSIHAIVLYDMARLLTGPEAVHVGRCEAPREGRPCGHWFIARGDRRGPPQKTCSGACRVAIHRQRKNARRKKTK
jgi:hypothetical protein